MSVTINSLLPRMRIMAPLVPEPVATFAMREAAIEFCRETKIVAEILPNITVVAGTSSYSLATTATPTQTRGVSARTVWLDGKELPPITASELEEDGTDWTDDTGTPTHYTQLTEGTLRLYPTPTAAGVLRVRAATAPTTAATEVDNALGDRWWKALVAGALAHIFGIPGQPFSNPDLAALHSMNFAALADDAKLAAYKGYTKARIRTRAHNF